MPTCELSSPLARLRREHHVLVWEPVEFSVQHLLNIDLRLSDADIALIIRPVGHLPASPV